MFFWSIFKHHNNNYGIHRINKGSTFILLILTFEWFWWFKQVFRFRIFATEFEYFSNRINLRRTRHQKQCFWVWNIYNSCYANYHFWINNVTNIYWCFHVNTFAIKLLSIQHKCLKKTAVEFEIIFVSILKMEMFKNPLIIHLNQNFYFKNNCELLMNNFLCQIFVYVRVIWKAYWYSIFKKIFWWFYSW